MDRAGDQRAGGGDTWRLIPASLFEILAKSPGFIRSWAIFHGPLSKASCIWLGAA